jgi:putative alpha-1,2-mannosidase
MGFYPDCPGKPTYMLTTPTFDKIELTLNKNFYPEGKLVIEKTENLPYIKSIKMGEKALKGYVISHDELTSCGKLLYRTKE